MSVSLNRQRLGHFLLFSALCTMVFFFRLLPLVGASAHWPGPDLIVLLGFAWVTRRPDYMPVLLFAAATFLGDLLFMRPPGLWAAISVSGLEFLRARAAFSRELPFAAEWAMVSGVFLAMIVAQRIVLALFLLPRPDPGMDGILWLATVAAYPAVVLACDLAFGVRKVAPGAVDDLGHRI